MNVSTLSSKLIHKGRVFNIYLEDVALKPGISARFEVIRHPGASVMVPFFDDHRVVMLKQYRHAIGDFIWEIPAGTLNPNETPEVCAKRELIEETGYSCHYLKKLTEITPLPGYSDERLHIFLASGLEPATQNLDQDEILDVHIMSIDQAVEMIYDGTIIDAKTIIGLQFAFRTLNAS